MLIRDLSALWTASKAPCDNAQLGDSAAAADSDTDTMEIVQNTNGSTSVDSCSPDLADASPIPSPGEASAPAAANLMRRNESAAAGLSGGRGEHACPMSSVSSAVRKNKSYSALGELSRRERSQPASPANRQAVVEAVVLELLGHMAAANPDLADPASKPSEKQLNLMTTYIETIVTQLDLPNSCIIAMLVYINRAVANESFALTDQNWQPSLLAAFVVAAKLSFDEPVWNEDFANALRISNVPVAQISRWEASFLALIEYNTNVDLKDYANLVFRLQQRYQQQRGGRSQFFTYLMLQAQKLDAPSGQVG